MNLKVGKIKVEERRSVLHIGAGTVLNNRYELVAEIGVGGFATVFRAFDQQLGRELAIKVLKQSKLCDDRPRFQREAKLLAQLSHKNIVSVFAIDHTDDLTLFIAMEYLKGRSLRMLLNEVDKLDYAQTAAILAQVCSALAYAHSSGVVHRDLSPMNIFLCEDMQKPTVKILDFGLSRLYDLAEAEGGTLTETGMLLGNPLYMSPELCRGEKVDGRTDIYALGCVLYECLCGERPFEADSPVGLLYMHREVYPKEPKLDWKDPEQEKLLKTITLGCLQKDPAKRFQSCEEIMQLFSAENLAASGKSLSFDSWLPSKRLIKPRFLEKAAILVGSLVLLCILIVCSQVFLRKQNKPQVQVPDSSTVGFLDKHRIDAEFEHEYKRALARSEKANGYDNPKLLTCLDDLAALYFKQCKPAQAEPLLKRILAIREKELGPNDPAIAKDLLDLAMNIQYQQRSSEAEPLLKRSLAIREKELQPNHPDIGWSLLRLAQCYVNQNRYAEAVPLFKRALAIREKELGPNHADVAASLNELADCYHHQGKDAEAEQMQKRARVMQSCLNKPIKGQTHDEVWEEFIRRRNGLLPQSY